MLTPSPCEDPNSFFEDPAEVDHWFKHCLHQLIMGIPTIALLKGKNKGTFRIQECILNFDPHSDSFLFLSKPSTQIVNLVGAADIGTIQEVAALETLHANMKTLASLPIGDMLDEDSMECGIDEVFKNQLVGGKQALWSRTWQELQSCALTINKKAEGWVYDNLCLVFEGPVQIQKVLIVMRLQQETFAYRLQCWAHRYELIMKNMIMGRVVFEGVPYSDANTNHLLRQRTCALGQGIVAPEDLDTGDLLKQKSCLINSLINIPEEQETQEKFKTAKDAYLTSASKSFYHK